MEEKKLYKSYCDLDETFNKARDSIEEFKKTYYEQKSRSDISKNDRGKVKPSLVPPAIIEAIAKIREYGTDKYGDPDNWKNVGRDRYFDAFLRHTLAEMNDPGGVDEESGMPHIWHAACNLAFIIQIDSAYEYESYRGFITKSKSID